MNYIDSDSLEDIRNAHACGISLAQLAAQAGVNVNQLRRMLGLPEWESESRPAKRKLAWDLPTEGSVDA